MGVYLPFHSSIAKQGEDARRDLHAARRAAHRGNTPGGMWKNLDESAKENRADASEKE